MLLSQISGREQPLLSSSGWGSDGMGHRGSGEEAGNPGSHMGIHSPKAGCSRKGPWAQRAALSQATEPKRPTLTLAAALPNLGAQATAGHGHVTLLQAQVVLLFSKPGRNTGGKTSPLDWHLRRKRMVSSLDVKHEERQFLPRDGTLGPQAPHQKLFWRCWNSRLLMPEPQANCQPNRPGGAAEAEWAADNPDCI